MLAASRRPQGAAPSRWQKLPPLRRSEDQPKEPGFPLKPACYRRAASHQPGLDAPGPPHHVLEEGKLGLRSLRDREARMAQEIRRREMVLQEKLRRVVEELRTESYAGWGEGRIYSSDQGGRVRAEWDWERRKGETEQRREARRDRRDNRPRQADVGRDWKQNERDTKRHPERTELRWKDGGGNPEKRRDPDLDRGASQVTELMQRSGLGVKTEPRDPPRLAPASRGLSRLGRVEFHSEESLCARREPCAICKRRFASDRLESHLQICEKVQRSNRKTFDSSKQRARGTELEKFMKAGGGSSTAEEKTPRQKNDALVRKAHRDAVPADGHYVACPHCSRRFAPGVAERHVPKCQNIRSRPPPPPRHRR
ncbi:zinc finger C2HC domain-containing protein 1C-like [Denticeps clupeoides]|uniref:C2HC/C3H-type domain-containing protein n=1 Tax=Denticeps clupeoides TaxID=299321 RepID=A0AAY4C547_9TELE|nr:zinc finger C2HC domain-containing protein 1C [Denticeps clupeoides]